MHEVWENDAAFERGVHDWIIKIAVYQTILLSLFVSGGKEERSVMDLNYILLILFT